MTSSRIKHLGEIERGLSKEEIEELAAGDAVRFIDGDRYDPLKVYVELKRYEVYLKALMDRFREPALQKAAEQETKVFRYMDALVQVSTWTKLDYSADAAWADLHGSIATLKESMKARESFLKAHNLVRRDVDVTTGEIIEEFRVPIETERRLTIRL